MSISKAYLLPNPEEFTPTVPMMMGTGLFSATLSTKADPARNEAYQVPKAYVGTYPVMHDDENVIVWSTACGIPQDQQ